jgi:hypothetical protein
VKGILITTFSPLSKNAVSRNRGGTFSFGAAMKKINYMLIFRESPYVINVFRAQKRVIRVMLGIGSRDSCRQSFVVLGILLLLSQYIFSLLCYVVNNIIS